MNPRPSIFTFCDFRPGTPNDFLQKVKFFIYQSGKQSGPFTQEDVRLQLLSGDLKSSYLAWHSRLAEWTPISRLASVALLDEDLSEPPDPKASSHYDAQRDEQPPRRRVRRSTERPSRSRSRSEPASSAPSAPPEKAEKPEKPEASRQSESGGERRVRRSRKQEQPPEEPSVGLWGQIKAFFEN